MGIFSEPAVTSYNHGCHNLKACLKLSDNNENNEDFPDWIVTTAFYACIHFTYSVAFPYYENEKIKYKNFEEYYEKEKYAFGDNANKHKLTADLALEVFSGTHGDNFCEMKNICFTARYYTYKTNPIRAGICKKWADGIKEYADKHHKS